MSLRLTVVSHACIEPVNQLLFAEVMRITDWEISIVLPSTWSTDFGGRSAARHPAFHGELVPLAARPRGNVPLHVYLTRARAVLRRLRPDVLYVHNEPYALSTFQFARAGPRDLRFGFYSAQNLRKPLPLPVRLMERSVLRRADFAMPVSDDVAQVLRWRGFRRRADVVELAVTTDPRTQRDEKPGPSDGEVRLGYVGRLTAAKGIATLLDAMRLIPRATLLVVGDGPERERLQDLATRTGIASRVTWAGYVPHDRVDEMYARMDLLVVPSLTTPGWKEQFGRVVVEALAGGVPVLASNSGELPKLMARTGGGWIFEEGRPDALAAVVNELVENPGELSARASAGRRYVEQNLTLDTIARRFASAMVPSRGDSS